MTFSAFSFFLLGLSISSSASSESEGVGMKALRIGSQVYIQCSWAPPETGGPVVRYHLDLSVNDGPWQEATTTTTTEASVLCSPGDEYRARVKGWNYAGFGPHSNPSVPFVPELAPPGSPGAPIVY